MEYILEELLRQRKALAVLMNGDPAERQEDGREERADGWNGGEMALAETGWDAYDETARMESGYLSTALRNGGEMAPGGVTREALAEDGRAVLRWETGEAENGGVSAGKATAVRAGLRLGRFYLGEQTFAEGPGLYGGAEAVEAVSVRTVMQWDSGRAEADARALSRAVQRDARRYDGGFMAR